MNILIVGKGISGQVARLKEEAKKNGHRLVSCASADLVVEASGGKFLPKVEGIDLAQIDLIYLLSVGRMQWEWYVVCDFLAKKYKTKIVERKIIDPAYKVFFSATSEYLKQVENDIPFPKTITFSNADLDAVLRGFDFPVIVKNSHGQRGEGLILAKTASEVAEFIQNDNKSKSFKIRQFIPNDGDIRVFTVGYKAIGAMRRVSKTGDFRSNISLGGVGEKFDLDKAPEIRKIAEDLSKLTHSEIAGVDVIINKETGEPFVLEINRGPQFAGLEKYTGVNVAAKIIEYFEHLPKQQ